jgi:BirA family transcriptional regulator, biotin operon repressor / biotin---[acetyl-CoA-carboxylase] ligase
MMGRATAVCRLPSAVIFQMSHKNAVRRLRSVTSTMDVCRAMHAQGAHDFSVVIADEQTAGRGRGDHRWHSPATGGLYVSVLLYPRIAAARGTWLTMIGALAVLDAVYDIAPALRVIGGLKWFNDVHLGGKKLAGVLVESALIGDAFEYAILGIGVNLSVDFGDAPDDVRARATSLHEHMTAVPDRDAFADRVLAHLRVRYTALHAGRSPLDDYARALRTLGQVVDIQSGDERIQGIARRVEDDGALIVSTASGERRASAGVLAG